jgi:hypothetical protein
MGWTSLRNNAVVPTIAKSSWHDSLEQTGPGRVVDVGDHRDPDRVRAHADLGVL